MKKQNQPLVSVIMPVYNTGEYLVHALESILHQTYPNVEFIIVDDASTDTSWKILKAYAAKYPSIRIFRNKTNRGISETVKKAISKAKGTYLARMDADDIALPQRLEKQVAYLEKHPETVAVGGQCLLIDKNNTVTGKKTFPQNFEEIYRYSFQFVPVQQPTLMIAKDRLPKDFVYYVDGMNTAEEVELFFKLFQYGKVENLGDVVLKYRLHDKNTSFLNIRQTFLLTLISRLKATYKYGYKPCFSDAVITLLQTIAVLILPRRVSLSLYKLLRITILQRQFTFGTYLRRLTFGSSATASA